MNVMLLIKFSLTIMQDKKSCVSVKVHFLTSFSFNILHMVENLMFLGQISKIEILMDLHVLRFSGT